MYQQFYLISQRPAESQNYEDDDKEEACKEAKSSFKFRPATLQSGQAEKAYTNGQYFASIY